ncbi:hypothetical protein [Cellulomonas triticagri]|uniref:Uncharacterized protein n=1 Tax=Cellulomonas triticagri TaxID=2483352 RepID=A0A3M2J7I9_9CELL|nr:hypothetical protein [Cellulomonas triticagri]RMI06915.1 hypothetical protein EBM89_14615 [Cellulomonas triticagri]
MHRAWFAAAREVEDARGDIAGLTVAVLVSTSGDAPAVAPPVLPLPEALASVDPAAAVDPDVLLPALSDTVASAMGWQPPHGEDVALARPEVVAALLPVARALLAHPASAWWGTDLDPDQSRTVWDDRTEAPAVGSTAARLAAWRRDVLEDERSRADYRRRHGVGLGGTWWVTPALAGLLSTSRRLPGAGSAALWMTEDDVGWDHGDVVPCAVDPGARVLEVHGPEDWAALVAAHPLDVTESRAPDWYGAVDARPGRWLLPDWSSVAREHDGVHVSLLGWLTTSGVAVPVPGRDPASTTLAGWDPDTTWWLADVPRREAAPTRWTRTDEHWDPTTP